MEIFLPCSEIRACEAFARTSGLSDLKMIKLAATAAANYIKGRYIPSKILVLCGGGNNGADGLLLASLLAGQYDVTVYQPLLGSPDSPNAFYRKQATENGVSFTLAPELNEYQLIVDAYYGIGFHPPLPSDIGELFSKINTSGIPVVALDVPSGIEADTGIADKNALKAERTLTFIRIKPGLMVFPGAEFAGEVVLLDTGIPVPEGISSSYKSLDDLSLYPTRLQNSHKGTFGTLCIYAGTYGMAGAAYLCALAAYRTGVGLVKIITAEENRIILQTMLPEAVLVCYDQNNPDYKKIAMAVSSCDALVAGPGIGIGQAQSAMLTMLFSVFDGKPMILDADALNTVANFEMSFPPNSIVTPHPKEFSRISKKDITQILESPLLAAQNFAKNHNVITLLKGARTVISAPSEEVVINLKGNNGMATAGSGDVLSGIIGALLVLSLTCFDAACLGAFIHGKAGDKAAEKIGKPSLMASDIANAISEVLRKI